jgi:co-chaperonin GroES (HSP10)
MIRPIGKKVLLLKEKAPEMSGSIYLVTSSETGSNTPPYAGTIVSIGSKCSGRLKPGMKVAYHWSGAVEIIYNDTLYILADEEIISGIIAKNVTLG